MKNIGIIVDNDFNNDIRVKREADILKRKGFNVVVLCFAFDNKQYDPISGLTIHRIKIKKKIKDILFFLFNRLPLYELLWKKEVRRFVQKYAIDIVHVHDLYMSKAVHSAIKPLGRKVPIILDLHENFPYAIQSYNWTKGVLRHWVSKPEAWVQKEVEYLSYASKWIVLSASFKEELLQRYSFIHENNIFFFPNVINFREFEQYNINPTLKRTKRVTLMYFGGVAERRGIFETLQVFEKGLENNLNIDLLIIGPIDKADKARFLDIINRPNLKNNINYIPWIDISELVSYMHISDIFLSPLIKNKQHESGIANKIFQYMYGAKPIIVSDCKPQKELIESCDCGLSYATQEEFLECITTLVQDEALRIRLGANGFKKLYEQYDNKDYENILLALYD